MLENFEWAVKQGNAKLTLLHKVHTKPKEHRSESHSTLGLGLVEDDHPNNRDGCENSGKKQRDIEKVFRPSKRCDCYNQP